MRTAIFVVLVAFTGCDSDSGPGPVTTNGFDATTGTFTPGDTAVTGPRCEGSPPSCGSLSSEMSQCVLTVGCEDTPNTCTGSSTSCAQRTVADCETGSGCLWSSAAQSCSGSAAPCSNYTSSESECRSVGCTFQAAGCTGSAQRCEEFPSSGTCTFQQGCNWNPGN